MKNLCKLKGKVMQKKTKLWLTAAVISLLSAGFVCGTEQVSAKETISSDGTDTATVVPVATATEVPVATNTTAEDYSGTSGWQKRSDGSIFYLDKDGKLAVGIVQIDGHSYLFSQDGTLRTGWQTIHGNRYYYDPDTGTAQFGWMEYCGERYYISEENGKLTGWADIPDADKTRHCYFDETGALLTGFFRAEEGGQLYYADASGGTMDGGIHMIGDVPYWFYNNGALHTGWQTVDGIRRYYNPNTGEIQTGWIVWNDYYYYVTAENGKYTGLQQVDGEYYPFSAENGSVTEGFCKLPDGITRYYHIDGSYHNGWLRSDDGIYYFADKGAMLTEWQTLENNIYYFGEDGRMTSGFQKIGGNTFYFDQDGRQQFGLQKIGNSLYYLDSDAGAMHCGWIRLDESTYYFQQDGTAKTGFFSENGKTYYFKKDAVMAIGWQTIDKKRYCFNTDGSMVTGWQTASNGKRYYFGTDGIMVTGWQEIAGDTYYFTSKGRCATGICTIKGARYYFDESSGALLKNATKNGVTTNSAGKVIKVVLNTPYLSQAGFPTGCESASAVMLLQAAGYSASIGGFIDNALDIGYLRYDNNTLYGPDPNQAFIGDPRSSHGYGCYAPVIVNALNRVATLHTAKNLTGTPISALLTDYIDKGTPVAVWATINMMMPESGTQWIVPETGGLFTWIKHEHCLVLVGYDENYYYMNDPYNSNGLRAYARSVVEARYAALGYQAVALVKN